MGLNFEEYGHRGVKFLKRLAKELKVPEDPAYADRLMTAFLCTLRDRYTIQESQKLLEILPMHFKGMYAHGWKLNPKPQTFTTINEFIVALRDRFPRTSRTPLGDDIAVQDHIRAIITLLGSDLSRAGIEQKLKEALPSILHELFDPRQEHALPGTM